MNKLLLLVGLIFLINACEKMPHRLSEGRNSVGKNNVGLHDVLNDNSSNAINQSKDEQTSLLADPPAFHEDKDTTKDLENKEQPIEVEDNKSKEINTVINDVEKILCEGNCSPYVFSSKRNLSELRDSINSELRDEGLDGVSIDINNHLEATLKGTVGCADEKNKAFEIAGRFKGVSQLKDMIFVVEMKEERL